VLRKSVEEVARLREITKSSTSPTNEKEAMEWSKDSPDAESRKARKLLAHGMIYGADEKPIKSFLEKL
jgi:hypothetical protein